MLPFQSPACTISVLHLANNNLQEEGGIKLANSLKTNVSITDLDVSDNGFTEVSIPTQCLLLKRFVCTQAVALSFADAIRPPLTRDKDARTSRISKFSINDNPAIGAF
jgi:hypothetical protein